MKSLLLGLVPAMLCTRMRQEYQGASRLETPKGLALSDHFGYAPSNSIYNPTAALVTTYSPVADSNYLRITRTPLQQPSLYPSDCSTVYKNEYELCMSATSCEKCLVNDSVCSWCRLGDRCFPTQVKASNCDQLCAARHQETDARQCTLPTLMNPGVLASVSKEASTLVPAEYAMGQTLEIQNDLQGYARQYHSTGVESSNTTQQDVRIYSPQGSHGQTTLHYPLNITRNNYNYTQAHSTNTLQFQQPVSPLSHIYLQNSSIPAPQPTPVVSWPSEQEVEKNLNEQVRQLSEQERVRNLREEMEESEGRLRERRAQIQREE